jgi:hypothetical protein
MQPEDVPIPDRLKGFPLFRGKFLVHYTVYVGADGQPDFKVVHEANRIKALEERLCHLCGKPLGKLMVLIGGPLSVQNRMFMDGPMDPECAEYAAKVCPYLANPNHGHSNAAPKHSKEDDTTIIVHEDIPKGRPARMAMYYTNGYDPVRVPQMDNAILIQAWAPIKIDWDFMPKGEESV